MDWFYKNICCCSSPRTNAQIIGYLHLVISLPVLCWTIFAKDSWDEDTDDESKRSASLLYGFQIIIPIITIILAIFVLIAVSNNNEPRFLLPWLIIKPFTVHIATGYAFYMGSIKNGKENEFATEIVLILKDVVISVIDLFCWLMILSYFFELSNDTTGNRTNPPSEQRATSTADQHASIKER
ncbi:uncharacterized protein LOC124313401 [Daphnia pulicaria]|uniref:uncharacterized protein LOC124313401 n=1 Tax=Daphnia pulicaria TaxID=35523 RepID=UPI001EEB7D17|nr:uncharacterized protein LOC124313401 [Daphnia pulicaria]